MPGAQWMPSGPARPIDAYQEHAPPASLAQYVECFWTRTGTAESRQATRSHRVMPDGCADVLLAFEVGGGMPVAMAVGTMTRPVVFRDVPSTRYLGARLRPGAAGVLFGIPAAELTDMRPSLDDVWGRTEALGESVAAANDTCSQVKHLAAELARRLLAADRATPSTVAAATSRIAAMHGNLSIRTLAADLGVTRQHLARSFAQHVGVSPKMLARILRARRIVEHARRATDVDWTTLALDAGYYDQSHLITDVKELTGQAPSHWLRVRG